ncbi:hypothetical protein EST38_g7183 [Candolleomyces aberdarensis]|uniref:N-acetyltransferase domain-containing protein n=1 Tax=Candolleomyces aberdarensis TaxID=2316362 RepID=A0A4Q2DHM0_9AGAR|nr:hypothetical protein EST38_g7183 [Candolleomyces aberdarensis]
MSAYGAITRSHTGNGLSLLAATIWTSKTRSGSLEDVAVYHLRLDAARGLTGLLEYMHSVFSKVTEEGRTYPQEGYLDQNAFESYFGAEDIFVGIALPNKVLGDTFETRETSVKILDAKGTRSWEEAIAGFYYVKPNYPGRSSHICNGGFVVPSINQGKGYGKALGESYLHYAPKLGYRGSVFNLVYVNNTASVRIWEGLGFIKAGRVPSAGRLKTKDGEGEDTNHLPGTVPIWKRGEEPLPPGLTEEDRPMLEQQKKWEGYAGMAMESCATKTVLAGGAGFGIGAFFSLMSASFAYEDPYLRSQTQTQAQLNTTQKASAIFKEMGKGMWTSGKGFAKVGALFAGIECVVESYRAKNDIYNSVASGFLSGGILARNSGPKAVLGGGVAFAAFSAAIDTFIRREPADDD